MGVQASLLSLTALVFVLALLGEASAWALCSQSAALQRSH